MLDNVKNNKLPIADVLKKAGWFVAENPKLTSLFVALNYIVCTAVAYSWKTIWLWPLLIVLYVLWGALFRYCFQREPYLAFRPMLNSMIPSSKILVLSVMVVSVLVILPIIPLFLPHMPSEFIDKYSRFLQSYMQEDDVIDAFINVIVTLLSPFIFYRPIFAWISSLIGRSGLLKSAFEKTRGNYWELLLLAIIINLSISLLYYLMSNAGLALWLICIPLSFLLLYFNLVLAQCYEFFFLDIESK